jgi:hypothetical protein
MLQLVPTNVGFLKEYGGALPVPSRRHADYCFNLKNRFPADGVIVMLSMPLLVVMV